MPTVSQKGIHWKIDVQNKLILTNALLTADASVHPNDVSKTMQQYNKISGHLLA